MRSNLCRSGKVATGREGFTLIEVLLVVIILGIIAAVSIPRFSNASATARANMLADDLRIMRMQISVFKAQHKGVTAGYPNGDTDAAPTAVTFIAHMTQSSNAEGQPAAPGTDGYPYGPYFSALPVNPVNGKATVEIIGDTQALPATANDSHGFIYKPFTMTLKADNSGTDERGRRFFDY